MVGREMLISVYDNFEKEATEQIENVEAAYPKQVKVIQSELDTLKGNSGTIGANAAARDRGEDRDTGHNLKPRALICYYLY